MAIEWEFEEQEAQEYGLLPVGDYRIRVGNVEEKKTRSGMDAINITFDVSGENRKLFYWLNFDMNNASITNQKLQSIFDSFGIERGNMNFQSWVGKVGACKVKHTNDVQYGEKAEVHYFLNKEQAKRLPAWVEGKSSNTTVSNDLPKIDDIQF